MDTSGKAGDPGSIPRRNAGSKGSHVADADRGPKAGKKD
jgi:hypothetical protein